MHAKIDAKKVQKNDAKRDQNEAKIDAKIIEFSCFFEKGEIYEIKPRLGREHDFTGSGHLKYMKSRYKMHTKSMPEKAMQKVWKMMPKWRPNGSQYRLKI